MYPGQWSKSENSPIHANAKKITVLTTCGHNFTNSKINISWNCRQPRHQRGEVSLAPHMTHNPRQDLGARLFSHNISAVQTSSMHDSARAESSEWANWAVAGLHGLRLSTRSPFQLYGFSSDRHAHSLTTHRTPLGVHWIRFILESRESGSSPGPGLT